MKGGERWKFFSIDRSLPQFVSGLLRGGLVGFKRRRWEEASLTSVLGTVFGGLLEGAAIDGPPGLAILEEGSFRFFHFFFRWRG